jgi:hypothetical protein
MRFVCAAALLAAASAAEAQWVAPTERLPLPDPGYGLYYQDAQSVPNVAARWGYHDGWTDGRHDRNHHDTYRAEEKDNYIKPPDHGDTYRDLKQDQYKATQEGDPYLTTLRQADALGGMENDRDLMYQEDDDTSPVMGKGKYMVPPDHGARFGVMRDRYIKEYRTAYEHGYQHGSRL